MQFSFLNELKIIRSDLNQAWQNIKNNGISLLDVAASVCSVALAIYITYLFNFEYSMWAAFSAYVVMRPFFKQTLSRGLLRIAGTLLGGACGVVLVLLFQRELNVFSVCLIFFIVSSASAYYANVVSDQYNYAVLFFGLTFTLIVGYAFAEPQQDILHIGLMRAADVMVGSLSTIFVSAVLQFAIKNRAMPITYPASHLALSPTSAPLHSDKQHYLLFALLSGGAIALTPLLVLLGGQLIFIQAAVSILAVSNQPRTASIDLPAASMKKIIYRALGCFSGALLGMGFNFICVYLSSYALLMLLTLVGTALGKILQDSSADSSYMGAQFAVGLLMVSVHDSASLLNDRYGVHRFLGVMVGLAILAGMLALFAPRQKLNQ
ncbi:FUSC family protein [Deefgea salmonis]|uniref:FUSC family protein n=1 Tax=Deefgea salmonis TaxID=2875502 RepID=A0ABS8BK34_9NEIS|nr:FUSC family protein [Deefgea salmonis]MCB5195891.1 FUSC family protein [Deefgea salmonis]